VHQARSCKSTLPESSTLRVEPVPSEDAWARMASDIRSICSR
jgi:hypothetical protein